MTLSDYILIIASMASESGSTEYGNNFLACEWLKVRLLFRDTFYTNYGSGHKCDFKRNVW